MILITFFSLCFLLHSHIAEIVHQGMLRTRTAHTAEQIQVNDFLDNSNFREGN